MWCDSEMNNNKKNYLWKKKVVETIKNWLKEKQNWGEREREREGEIVVDKLERIEESGQNEIIRSLFKN